jgi:hypothetical protein
MNAVSTNTVPMITMAFFIRVSSVLKVDKNGPWNPPLPEAHPRAKGYALIHDVPKRVCTSFNSLEGADRPAGSGWPGGAVLAVHRRRKRISI